MIVLGIWTPYFYIAEFGIDHGMERNLAGYLFAMINAGSFVGRVGGGFLANALGQFNVITAAAYTSAILIFSWLAVSHTGGIIALAVDAI